MMLAKVLAYQCGYLGGRPGMLGCVPLAYHGNSSIHSQARVQIKDTYRLPGHYFPTAVGHIPLFHGS